MDSTQPSALPSDVIAIIIEHACMIGHPRIVLTFMKTSKFFRRTVLRLLGGYPILRVPIVIPRRDTNASSASTLTTPSPYVGTLTTPSPYVGTLTTPSPSVGTLTNRTLTSPTTATIVNPTVSSGLIFGGGLTNTNSYGAPNVSIMNDGSGRLYMTPTAPRSTITAPDASGIRDLRTFVNDKNMREVPKTSVHDQGLPWWVHPERHYVVMCDNNVCAIYYAGGSHVIMDMTMCKYSRKASAQCTIDTTYKHLAPYRQFLYGKMHYCDHSTAKVVTCADVMERFNVDPSRIISLNRIDATQRYGIKNVEITSWMEHAYNFSQVLDSIFHWYPIVQDDVIKELDSYIKYQSELIGEYTETRQYDMYTTALMHILLRTQFVRDCFMYNGSDRQLMRLRRYVVLCRQLEDPIRAVYPETDANTPELAVQKQAFPV